MSGYECEDCGSYDGVHHGTCLECTPNVIKILGRELDNAKRYFSLEFQRKYRKEEDIYVEEKTKILKDKYNELLKRYTPKKEDPRYFTKHQPNVTEVLNFIKEYRKKLKIE